MSFRHAFLAGLGIASALAAGAARAEENRLLPFWGQPFPAGFTRTEIGEPAFARCPPGERFEIRRDGRGRCIVVLHARG